MSSIAQSVGARSVNRDADVRTVQTLLNRYGTALGLAPLLVNGKADGATLAAIRLFQRRALRLPVADGRIDPGGRSWLSLSGATGPVLAVIAASAADMSGTAWWRANQARFPNSSAVSDLAPGFVTQVTSFIAALRKAGATVDVSATRRNKIRAYLMHYCWTIAKGTDKAADIPAEPGCSIIWDHGDDTRSRRAAQDMVDLFDIVFQPSLASRHIPGLAIDMTISWSGTIKVRNASGKDVALSTPVDDTNTTLHGIGASYGVRKLLSDPPHWSDNGH
jgi:hypothetical protein